MWFFGAKNEHIEVATQDDISIEELKKENENLKKALLIIQANLAQSVDYSKEAVVQANITQSEAANSVEGILALTQKLSSLRNISDATSSTADTLTDKANQISKIVKLINDIAMQTNILSLNAAVEAARAGEYGLGFAVVADEVKKLADNTRSAVDEISNIVTQVVDEIEQVNRRSTEISQSVSDAQDQIRELETVVNNASQNAENIKHNLEKIDAHEFMTLAKLDHIIWKINTYLSILHKEPIIDFVDHKNCRLGKWYEKGDGKAHFACTRSYGKLPQPHSIVHNATHHIFELLEQSPIDWDEISRYITMMENASDGVFETLDSMLNEKEHSHQL